MNTEQAVQKMIDVIRRKHFALNTERSYCAWLRRYCDFVKTLPSHWSSEQKLEQFLTALAKNDVAASTQNQAFDAVIYAQRPEELFFVSVFQERRIGITT